jgi:hypothetical protein
MVKVHKVTEDFRPGFYAALGRMVVAAGRVEYELKLVLKSLLGKGMAEGMEEAERKGRRLSGLCERVMQLAAQKLPDRERVAVGKQVAKALKLMDQRNDHIHAFWVPGPRRNAARIRPRLDKSANAVRWDRSRPVRISELHALAANLRGLQRALNKARRFTWPKVL